ncbi:hypothetical protein [uncultured Parasphingorhabdus sp.]|uniref:ArnT family glycosyltransferase n=1 Tax=uncultured Parasphingorhabdus sp. TaxID=2709694 RepID=UPI002AA87D8A|nr:hypothetical protein [uncultured Parasphingorhabdus sp.]
MNIVPEQNAESAKQRYLISGVLIAVVCCQIWLIFQKAINWDEFLHFGQIYELADGRLSGSLQSLHVRLFGWAAMAAENVITQIQIARIAMLVCVLFTTGCIVLLSRRLVDGETALLSGLVYLTAGFVFTNAFTYRPDPVAAAALMGALSLLVFGSFSWKRVILSGLLVGLAGALTIKSVFYAPCFAAVAYLQWRDTTDGRFHIVYRSTAVLVVAMFAFALIVGLHGSNLPAASTQGSSLGGKIDSFLRFFEFEQIRYVLAEMALAPLLTLGLILLVPVASGLPRNIKILLLGLCGPLLCILFYRNTFPYFFTFLLPPVCVAITPVLAQLVRRYGFLPVIIVSLFGPAFLLVNEPYGTLERQRATISEIERLFPEPTSYLSYSSYMPEYPRQFRSLISGVALGRYWQEREGQIARDIEDGRIAFVIATGDALDLVYQTDGPAPLLPASDVAALRSNFLRYSDTIFIAGKNVCSQGEEQELRIFRSGVYSVDGGDLVIDGRHIADQHSVSLTAGTYLAGPVQGGCVKLWALDHVPELPEDFPEGPIAGGF